MIDVPLTKEASGVVGGETTIGLPAEILFGTVFRADRMVSVVRRPDGSALLRLEVEEAVVVKRSGTWISLAVDGSGSTAGHLDSPLAIRGMVATTMVRRPVSSCSGRAAADSPPRCRVTSTDAD